MNCISILYCLSLYDVVAEDNEVYLVNCHRNSNDTIIDLTPYALEIACVIWR